MTRPQARQAQTIYRWLSGVPLRDGADAIAVNWISIEVRDSKGKRTYANSFVTDLPVTAGTVAELAACGRARWKVDNEKFNVLKKTATTSSTISATASRPWLGSFSPSEPDPESTRNEDSSHSKELSAAQAARDFSRPEVFG